MPQVDWDTEFSNAGLTTPQATPQPTQANPPPRHTDWDAEFQSAGLVKQQPTYAGKIPAGSDAYDESHPVISAAKKYLGTPYQMPPVPGTIDCSLFSKKTYADLGIQLPRTAQSQFDATQRIDKPRVGDLVFLKGTYGNDPNKVTHVMIYAGNGKVIAAQSGGRSREVRWDGLNSTYNQKHFAGFGRVKGADKLVAKTQAKAIATNPFIIRQPQAANQEPGLDIPKAFQTPETTRPTVQPEAPLRPQIVDSRRSFLTPGQKDVQASKPVQKGKKPIPITVPGSEMMLINSDTRMPTPQEQQQANAGYAQGLFQGLQPVEALAQTRAEELAQTPGRPVGEGLLADIQRAFDIQQLNRLRGADAQSFPEVSAAAARKGKQLQQYQKDANPVANFAGEISGIVPLAADVALGGAGLKGAGLAEKAMRFVTPILFGAGMGEQTYQNSIAEGLAKNKVDVTDANALSAFVNDTKKMDAVKSYAMKKAVPDAVINTVFMGLGGIAAGAIAPEGSAALRTAGGAMADQFLQAAGQTGAYAAGQAATGEQIDPREAATRFGTGLLVGGLMEAPRVAGALFKGKQPIHPAPSRELPIQEPMRALPEYVEQPTKKAIPVPPTELPKGETPIPMRGNVEVPITLKKGDYVTWELNGKTRGGYITGKYKDNKKWLYSVDDAVYNLKPEKLTISTPDESHFRHKPVEKEVLPGGMIIAGDKFYDNKRPTPAQSKYLRARFDTLQSQLEKRFPQADFHLETSNLSDARYIKVYPKVEGAFDNFELSIRNHDHDTSTSGVTVFWLSDPKYGKWDDLKNHIYDYLENRSPLAKKDQPAPAPAAKEPWQMTREEWHNALSTDYARKIAGNGTAVHKNHVLNALADGEKVPQHIIDEYPGILEEANAIAERIKAMDNAKQAERDRIESVKKAKEESVKQKSQAIQDKMLSDYEDLIANRHNMTLAEYMGNNSPRSQGGKLLAYEHRSAVEKALSEGKPVPAEVLADYPDLKTEPAPTAPTKGKQVASEVEAVTPKPEPVQKGKVVAKTLETPVGVVKPGDVVEYQGDYKTQRGTVKRVDNVSVIFTNKQGVHKDAIQRIVPQEELNTKSKPSSFSAESAPTVAETKASVKDEPTHPKIGLTKTQAEYLNDKLQNIREENDLPAMESAAQFTKTFDDAKLPEPETIKVPGDGQYTVASSHQVVNLQDSIKPALKNFSQPKVEKGKTFEFQSGKKLTKAQIAEIEKKPTEVKNFGQMGNRIEELKAYVNLSNEVSKAERQFRGYGVGREKDKLRSQLAQLRARLVTEFPSVESLSSAKQELTILLEQSKIAKTPVQKGKAASRGKGDAMASTETALPSPNEAKRKSAPVPQERIQPAPLSGGTKKKVGEIILNLSDSLGMKIQKGKTKPGTGGTYYPGTSKTVIRYAGDMGVAAHEIAHRLDDLHNIVGEWSQPRQRSPFDAELFQPTFQHTIKSSYTLIKKRAEGVAEFIRAYLINPDEARNAAPSFARYLESKIPQSTMKKLTAFGNDVRLWSGMSSLARTTANIADKVEKPTIKERVKNIKQDYIVSILDDLYPLREGITKAGELKGKSALEIGKIQDKVRLVSGSIVTTEEILNGGHKTAKGQPIKSLEGGIGRILDPLDSKNLDREVQELGAYMISQRTASEGMKLEAQGQDPRKAKISGAGGGIYNDFDTAMATIQEVNLDAAKKARFDEAAKTYREWADANLRYLRDKGRISAEQYDKIKADNPEYVDMHRVMDEAGIPQMPKPAKARLGSVGKPIDRFTGSTREIESPIVSLIQQTERAVKEADRNEALRDFTNLLDNTRDMYEGDPIDLAAIGSKGKEGDKNTIRVFKNGKASYYTFDEPIYKALKGWGETLDSSLFAKGLQAVASLIRSTITHSPPFLVRNTVRDTETRAVLSEIPGLPTFHVGKDLMRELRLSGGDQAGHYMTSRIDYYKMQKRLINERATGKRKFITIFPQMLEGYEKLARASETVNRTSEYARAKKYAKDVLGYNDQDAQRYAAARARDLMDFAIGGTLTKSINRYIPFTNAAVQGTRRAIQGFKKNPTQFATRWMMYVGIPSISAYLWNASQGQDTLDEYRQLPAYQRDFFYNFKLGADTWARIPKPFELGTMGSGLERLMDKTAGNPDAFNGFGGDVAKSLLPVDESAVAGPLKALFEVKTNYDFFRDKAIISPFEADVALELRKGNKNASALGQSLEKVFKVDARNIDHLITGLIIPGDLGRTALNASDALAGKGKQRNPITTWGNSAVGLLTSSPAYASPDVQYVLKTARDWRLTSNSEVKQLNDMLSAIYEAKDNAERDRLARQVRDYAKELRPRVDEMAAQKKAEAKSETPTKGKQLGGYRPPDFEAQLKRKFSSFR